MSSTNSPREPLNNTSFSPVFPGPRSAPSLDDAGVSATPVPYPRESFAKLENVDETLQAQAVRGNYTLSDQYVHSRLDPPVQSEAQVHKSNRLRKACDSCSIRKVKCDESGPPCRACLALELPCTFDRPSRRRGPPNRHAEAIKRRRLEDEEPHSATSSPQSSTSAAHAHPPLQSSHPVQLSAEMICSLPTMNALIDDFFIYIHPLCPFPHEPSFREAWERREDYINPSFLALLASMIACLVASFPRKPRLHLKTQTRHEYPSHLSLVDKCREVCAQARGPGYLDRPTLNVYDACTSYFLGLTGAYVFQWRQLRLYLAECLTIIRTLGFHKPDSRSHKSLGSVPSAWGSNETNQDDAHDKVDHITEQIGRRIFWTVLVGARTIQQLGASLGELIIPPPTSTDPLPPLPLEVDDAYIFPHEIRPQPENVVSLMTGFNINVRVYSSYSALVTAELAFGADEVFDWNRQQRVFEQSLHQCRQVFNNIPEILKVQPNAARSGGFPQRQPYYPPLSDDPTYRQYMATNPNSDKLHGAHQYEIQKANIYASHLATRSYLVEKYFLQLEKFNSHKLRVTPSLHSVPSALSSGLDRTLDSLAIDAEQLERTMADEREQVVKDLLVVLGSIDMVNMEPNGDSFTQKIRSIASTLLEVPKERKGSVALQHQDYLYRFLDILSKLERISSPEGSDPMSGSVDEETELRLWADLREHQMKFQEQGGLYGLS